MNAAIVEITEAQLVEVLAGRAVLDLPEGARIAAWWFNLDWVLGRESNRRLEVKIEHESLPGLVDGCRLPILRLVSRKPVAAERNPLSLAARA